MSWFYEYRNQYDSNGKLIKQQKYDDDGNIRAWITYAYPDDSGAYETTSYRADGTIEAFDAYDKDGENTSWIRYEEDGTVSYQSSWVNTKAGRMSTISRSTNYWHERTYDDYGNITQYVTKDPKNDTIIERTEYKYQEMK